MAMKSHLYWAALDYIKSELTVLNLHAVYYIRLPMTLSDFTVHIRKKFKYNAQAFVMWSRVKRET